MLRNLNIDRCTAATPACAWQPASCATIDEVQAYLNGNGHLCWEVLFERKDAVVPTVMDRQIGAIRLRRIHAGACRAQRGSGEIRRDRETYFCLAFLTGGCEVLHEGAKRMTVECGDIATWHSSQTLSFESTKAVEKLSIYVPEESMKRIFVHPASCAGLYLKRNSGIVALLASYLSGLCSNFAINDERTEAEIEEVTLELIGAAIVAHVSEASIPQRAALWERIIAFIDRNLEDPELKPVHITGALGISLRNLHLLFAERGHTVAGWIRVRRLERCRAELAKFRGACTITEVAFRWGFNDAAHFSRTFKAHYGLSPRSFQQRTMS